MAVKYKKVTELEWDNIKLNFITRSDEPSLRTLSNEFDIPLSTMANKSRDDNWVEEKNNFHNGVLAKVKGEIEQTTLSRIRQRNTKYIEWIDSVIAKACNKFSIELEKDRPAIMLGIKDITELMKTRKMLLGDSPNIRSLIININKPVEEMNNEEIKVLRSQIDLIKAGKITEAEFVTVEND